jgi:hypothetical protein
MQTVNDMDESGTLSTPRNTCFIFLPVPCSECQNLRHFNLKPHKLDVYKNQYIGVVFMFNSMVSHLSLVQLDINLKTPFWKATIGNQGNHCLNHIQIT